MGSYYFLGGIVEEIIIKEMVTALLNQFTTPILTKLKILGSDSLSKTKVAFNVSFTAYLERSYERYSKTKTLLYRDMPVNLRNFYVRTDLIINSKKVDGSGFIRLIEKNKRIIVTGSAGCGKSTFCKSVFIELIEEPMGIFPVFIELRHLNNTEDKSLYGYILNEMISVNPNFDKKQLDYALKLGKVLIILDGFDEVDNDHRHIIEKEILNLSNNNNGIRLLISSRFDNRFSSWNEFYNYRINSLDKVKALELINKLEYDESVKENFIVELDTKLFETHKSFASNPLLLTLMLLTYEQIAEIPNKIHLFYEQAFLTLYNKHDSFKSLYRRNTLSKLSIDDFKKVLEIFCLYSYCENKYYFKYDELKKYLERSIKVSNIDVSSSDFLSDLLDAVCVLQRDGLGFTFTHRSFQEYFTALFLVNKTMSGKFQLFEKISSISFQDNVIDIILDIDINLLEKEWIIPKIDMILKSTDSIHQSNTNRDLELLAKFYSSIIKMPGGKNDEGFGYSIGDSSKKFAYFIHYLTKIYQKDYYKFYDEKSKKTKDNEYFEELLIEKLYEDGDINLDDIGKIDPYFKELIRKSDICRIATTNIDFMKLKVDELRKKHQQEKEDIFSLIFN